MSWLGLDDQILNHPKFIRAVKLGGSETVHAWLGIRAYCAQNRTDGFVPTDMLEEIRGPLDTEKRATAVKVLRKVGLLDSAVGGVQMHNFSKWLERQFGARQAELGKKGGSVSSETKRQAAIEREAKRRLAQDKTTSDDHNEPQAACASDHKREAQQTTSLPSPVPIQSNTTTGVVVAAESEPTDPTTRIRCPAELPIDADTLRAFDLDVGLPASVALPFLRSWAATQRADANDLRTLGSWLKCAEKAARGEWSKDKSGMRAAAERAKQTTAPPVSRLAIVQAADERARAEATEALKASQAGSGEPPGGLPAILAGIGGAP